MTTNRMAIVTFTAEMLRRASVVDEKAACRAAQAAWLIRCAEREGFRFTFNGNHLEHLYVEDWRT